MTNHSLEEAEAGLPDLIDRAIASKDVVIAGAGQPVAEIDPTVAARSLVVGSHEWLFSRRVTPAPGTPNSVELLNMIYEDGGA